jgi:CRP-like cAMP-binding protein
LDRECVSGALIQRLQSTSALDGEDVRAIRSLPYAVRRYPANQPIVRDGDRPWECCLIMDGFCLRSKTTSVGQTQILSFHIPGDIPDLESLHLHVMDHDLVTLTECTLGFISHTALRDLTRRRYGVAEALWRETLIDAARFREWIVNVGQRPAISRLAHMVVEMRERLKVIGRAEGDCIEMPFTQEQLGDAMGITPVHVNRVLKQLRDEGFLEFSRGAVTVINEAKLLQLADFDDVYLHQRPSS